jgi:hypothetical protein
MKDTRIRLNPSLELRKWIKHQAKLLGISEADYVLRLIVDARQADLQTEKAPLLKKAA